jgi:hypothetical protein
MKQLTVTAGLIILGVLFKLLTDRLSADAVGLVVGLTFGMLAGLPTVLLLLVALRQQGRGGRGAYGDDFDDVYLGGHDRRALPAPWQPDQNALHYDGAPFPAAQLVDKDGAR